MRSWRGEAASEAIPADLDGATVGVEVTPLEVEELAEATEAVTGRRWGVDEHAVRIRGDT